LTKVRALLCDERTNSLPVSTRRQWKGTPGSPNRVLEILCCFCGAFCRVWRPGHSVGEQNVNGYLEHCFGRPSAKPPRPPCRRVVSAAVPAPPLAISVGATPQNEPEPPPLAALDQTPAHAPPAQVTRSAQNPPPPQPAPPIALTSGPRVVARPHIAPAQLPAPVQQSAPKFATPRKPPSAAQDLMDTTPAAPPPQPKPTAPVFPEVATPARAPPAPNTVFETSTCTTSDTGTDEELDVLCAFLKRCAQQHVNDAGPIPPTLALLLLNAIDNRDKEPSCRRFQNLSLDVAGVLAARTDNTVYDWLRQSVFGPCALPSHETAVARHAASGALTQTGINAVVVRDWRHLVI